MHPTLEQQIAQHLSAAQAEQVTGLLSAVNDTYAHYDATHQADLEAMQYHLKEAVSKLDAAQSQLLQADKMASIGQLAAGVAHEINNPIGYVYSNLTTLDRYVSDLMQLLNRYEQLEASQPDTPSLEDVRQYKTAIDLNYLRSDLPALMSESQEGISRVKKIVQDLKDFSHVDEAEWLWTDLRRGLDSTLNIVHNELKTKVEIVRQYGTIPEVQCIASQINQVFMNLLVNASHAIETKGTITIATGSQNDEVWVKISDTGCGISKENLSRIFDAFFTTKPVGKGTGLGLSLSYSIVKRHHGRIEVDSEVGKGTSFTVHLPVMQPAAQAAEEATRSGAIRE